MAATSLSALLTTLSDALTSAIATTPEVDALFPPPNGISLLDVKNDLFLSYLQNLVFLIILKIRNAKAREDVTDGYIMDDAVVKKLVELRLYIEKGVRPLESRLKYQIDKVLRAADDAVRASALPQSTTNREIVNGKPLGIDDESHSDSDDSEDADNDIAKKTMEIDDEQYAPNLSLIAATSRSDPAVLSKGRGTTDGLYKPPRITATSMPTTTGRAEKVDKRLNKSATLEEFVATELSSAPLAEPSIGSTIVSSGRRVKSDKERATEAERREYEERNYVRLPKVSKKEARKNRAGRDVQSGYGGEEWRGLGDGFERIERLTGRKAGGVSSVLEKSRKRGVDAVDKADGPRGSGMSGVGEGLAKRVKMLDGAKRERRKRA